MSPILTLSDDGYRTFGPLPATGPGLTSSQVVELALRCDDYEAAGAMVRRRSRKKGMHINWPFEVVTVIDRATPLTDELLSFIDVYLRSQFINNPLPRFTTESSTIRSLLEEGPKEPDRWRGMYRLEQALFYAGPQRLRPALRDHVIPSFFGLYPESQIAVIRYSLENDDAASMMRVLYAAAQAPLGQVAQNFLGIRALQEWHMNSVVNLGPVFIEFFNHLFYPFIGGSRGGPVGLDFVFLFEPAERYSPAVYPRNWLAKASTAASFGKEHVNTLAYVQDYKGPVGQHAAHQRHLFPHGYGVTERLALLRWYIDRVNRLLYELADVANFTEDGTPQATIDPVFGYEHHMTVDRLARKTLLSMSLEEMGTGKFMVFEVAELYDTLSHLFQGTPATDFFKSLFHPVEGPALLCGRLAQLPAPFGSDLPALVNELYQKIQQTVIESVWLKSKVTATDVLVRNKTLAAETPVPHADFVAELMRCYRNGHHGYFTANDKQGRPSRYLALVTGNLPAEMSVLPALWWLAYLADPGMVGWKHLPINEYDC